MAPSMPPTLKSVLHCRKQQPLHDAAGSGPRAADANAYPGHSYALQCDMPQLHCIGTLVWLGIPKPCLVPCCDLMPLLKLSVMAPARFPITGGWNNQLLAGMCAVMPASMCLAPYGWLDIFLHMAGRSLQAGHWLAGSGLASGHWQLPMPCHTPLPPPVAHGTLVPRTAAYPRGAERGCTGRRWPCIMGLLPPVPQCQQLILHG